MGKPTGFMEYPRQATPKRPAAERVRDWNELYAALPEKEQNYYGELTGIDRNVGKLRATLRELKIAEQLQAAQTRSIQELQNSPNRLE